MATTATRRRRRPVVLDMRSPLNREHPHNKNLLLWLYGLSQHSGGKLWRDLVSPTTAVGATYSGSAVQAYAPAPFGNQLGPVFVGSAGSSVNLAGLSGYSRAFLECWFFWDSYTNDDDLLLELSTNYNSNNAFIIDPNASDGTFTLSMHGAGGTGYASATFTRPTAAVWHHFGWFMDRTVANDVGSNRVFLNGAPQAVTDVGTSTLGDAFGSYDLYLFSRNNSSLLGNGRIAGLRISGLTSTLSADERAKYATEAYTLAKLPSWKDPRLNVPSNRTWFVPVGGGATSLEFTGSVTPTGVLTKAVSKPITGSVTPAGVLTKAVAKPLIGTVTLSGVLTKSTGKPLTGTVTLTGVLTKAVGKSLTGSVALAGILTKAVIQTLTGTVTLTGVLTKVVTKALTGGVTLGGVLSAGGVNQQNLSGSISPSGLLTCATAMTKTGSVTLVGVSTKAVSKALTGLLTLAGVLTRTQPGAVTEDGGPVWKRAGTFSRTWKRLGTFSRIWKWGE